MDKKYAVMLVDRKKAKFFILNNGKATATEEFVNGLVPQRVKHGDNAWDAQDKINRHIEEHLHRHLQGVNLAFASFIQKNPSNLILIGSHRTLFSKIKKHLSYPYSKKVKGYFVTELKMPFGDILKRVNRTVEVIEEKEL